MKKKNQRILTIKYDWPPNSKEWIEYDTEYQTFFWKATEGPEVGKDVEASCSFPIPVWFVKEKFEEQGREFDEARCPLNPAFKNNLMERCGPNG
jgi:hypothetical protein